MNNLIPVILCGGSGTRLWPLSRSTHPKQFIEFENGRTLFQQTIVRTNDLLETTNPIVVSNKSHIQFVCQDLTELGLDATLIIEPETKNTAPAIALAALTALKQTSEAILLVLPSDHVIKGTSYFQKAVANAIELANLDLLVTFGIVPTGPETGFGYIEQGKSIGFNGYAVEQFVEKPCLDLAKKMLAEGGFYWNSGIFIFKAQVFINELKKFDYKIYEKTLNALDHGEFYSIGHNSKVVQPNANEFRTCPSNSIDYAVMEKTQQASVIPLSIEWNDMGTWSSFFKLGEKDSAGNVTRGNVVAIDTHNCYINSTNRLIATVGLKDFAIVETKDAVFFSPLNRVQDVKKIVDELKKTRKTVVDLPPVVIRPWGSYESLAIGDHYQTKRIIVRPGEQLSLQLHHHRSEHWTVVEGYPEITIGNETKIYSPNASVYIPRKCVHRLTNHTDQIVTIIEVQCGDYLGEDDIVRLEDKYLRN